jgi:antitoxin CptB
MTGETQAIRLKRLTMRAWRRGTKEMDLILGPWADAHLGALPEPVLADFERLLDENDQDLYGWITGQDAGAPVALAGLIADIGAHARSRLRGGG